MWSKYDMLRVFWLKAIRLKLVQVMAVLAQHSWEQESHGEFHVHHAWEVSDEEIDPFAGVSVDSDSEAEPEPRQAAAAEFLEVLMGLYFASALSAGVFCVLCYWAWKAGMPGRVQDYAKAPGAQSGKYQDHLNGILGFNAMKHKMYNLEVVGNRRHDLSRTKFDLPVMPLHESIAQEIDEDPTLLVRLQEKLDDGTLPESYYDNPVVEGSADPVMPIAIYIDGVPYSLTDSVVAVWVMNLISGVRHLVALVRKKLCCKCGCRGWDTFFPLLFYLKCCCRPLAAGVYPSARHDNTPWKAEDSYHEGLQGQIMKVKCCLLRMKGDWMEFCERFGFPTWGSGLRPCFCCTGFGDCLFDPKGINMFALPWHVNTDNDFDVACRRCEKECTVTAINHKSIVLALEYDKRKQGSCGRALKWDLPDLFLKAGDRLEPTETLIDVQGFDDLVDFPVQVLFWRCSEQTACLRRCPFWDADIGITPSIVICIDMLHTLYLGSIHTWCKTVLWLMLLNGVCFFFFGSNTGRATTSCSPGLQGGTNEMVS